MFLLNKISMSKIKETKKYIQMTLSAVFEEMVEKMV